MSIQICNECGEEYYTSNKGQHKRYCGHPKKLCDVCGEDMTRWKNSCIATHRELTDCTKRKKTTQKKKKKKRKNDRRWAQFFSRYGCLLSYL